LRGRLLAILARSFSMASTISAASSENSSVSLGSPSGWKTAGDTAGLARTTAAKDQWVRA